MKSKPPLPTPPTPLRRRAEVLLSKLAKETTSGTAAARTPADTQKLLHELQVHQVELEMQNEELRKARNEIEEGLEKFSDLYDFAPIGYLTLDFGGAIREANLTAASLLGLSRALLVKRRLVSFMSPADRPLFLKFLQQVFARAEHQECEVRLLRPDQPATDVRLRANLIASGEACRVTMADITRHKQAEADRLVVEKLESTGILAGGIAHDFNNLLTIILLNLELAGMSPPPGGQGKDFLGSARQAALLAHELTQQLITFSEGGQPVRKPTRLAGVIQEAVRLALDDARWPCEFLLADDFWLVDVDNGQFAQVIRNVILNAREAMPEGGAISVRMKNVVLPPPENPLLPPGNYVRVSISDQGGGIAPEVLPRIFDPYFSTKPQGKQKGMGLGLTICHAIMQKHDGAITVDTTVGEGTTFHLYLPASESAKGRASPGGPGPVARSRLPNNPAMA